MKKWRTANCGSQRNNSDEEQQIHITDDLSKFALLRFPRSLLGDEISHLLARITINWGRLEQALYWSTRSIDKGLALKHAQTFFSTPATKVQKERARKALAAVVQATYRDLLKSWDDMLTIVEGIQTRRNLLSHGIWEAADGKEGLYKVHPIRFDKVAAGFGPPAAVDHAYVAHLIEDLEQIINQLSMIAAEFMAHQQLQKWENNRITYTARIASQRDK